MNIKPLGDRVIIKDIDVQDVTHSGIIIPDIAKEKPLEGEVVAVGELVTLVMKGDRVLYGKYSGTEIKVDGQLYLIMHQEDILGRIGG